MEDLNLDKGLMEIKKIFSFIKIIGAKDPLIKEIKELINNKSKANNNLFVMEGLWGYEKIIQSKLKIKTFVFCPEFIKTQKMLEMTRNLIDIAEKSYIISNKLSDRLTGRDGSEGFFIIGKMSEYDIKDIPLRENNLIVILDGIDQAGNIGTIIRSVDGAGADAVIMCNHRVRRTNNKLIKSSTGTAFVIPFLEMEMDELAKWLQKNNFKMILTDLSTKQTYLNADYMGKVAIIAGNEMHGVSKEWYNYDCTKIIIPMFGSADSLNVGVATTLITYEASLRQKGIIKNR